MFSHSLPASTNYLVRIRCLLPPTLSTSSSLLMKPLDRNFMTTTTTKNISSNSFGFPSSKSSTSQTTCNICKRLLYSFEEILVCRICYGSYHWRCVKPETISHYGENAHFICDKCNDNITTTNPSHRLSNGSIKIKSPDSIDADYRDFASIPSKLNTTPTKDTTVVNAIRFFEEKQQQQQQSQPHKITKLNEFDGHLSSQTNGQYTDDSKTFRRIQQQNGIENDDENKITGVFHANYQYTPLKEYAAMKNGRPTNDTNGYQNPSSIDSDRQLSSRYNGGLHYPNHDYEPSKSPTHFTSPTIDNLTIHNRQQHFVSTTNLNVNDQSSRHQQQNDHKNPLNHSTPYLSQVHDDDDNSPIFKSSLQQQQQTDRHSNVGSDSGIVIINPIHQQQTIDDNKIIEKKLTDLVQKLGRQLETDAQKLNEKLELKLKNLEHMINQQTYIIRRQDEVIERLKSKILKIETERDHFRDRLSIHEQLEQDEKKHDNQQQTLNDISTNRKYSNTSSTEHSRPSTKKTPAPRVDQHGLLINNENESTVAKFIKTIPANPEQLISDSTTPSIATKLVSSVPLLEKPAAASRLDNIIHQSNTNNITDSTSPYYNLSEVHDHDPKQIIELISMEQQAVTSIHHDDEQIKPIKSSDTKPKRSSSTSSTTSSTSAAAIRPDAYNLTSREKVTLPAKNSNFHRSLESIQRKTSQTEQGLKPTNKTASLEFGTKPVRYDDPSSIYVIPTEAIHPASQYQDVVKGWLRKQNPDSLFKRIQRYYCVLWHNAILMHKHENDRIPQKAVNLKGAKVRLYEDQKHGPSLQLTWSNRFNDPKHYHLYAPNAPEAEKWLTGIQTAIYDLETKNNWQRYRMNT